VRLLTLAASAILVSAALAGCASHKTASKSSGPSPSVTFQYSAAPKKSGPDMTDPYIWLENSADPKTQKWVQDHNASAKQVLESDPRFKQIGDQARAIIVAQDRIPYPSQHGKMVRNFWQDQAHQRGYVRQTTTLDYMTANPTWESVLDIDALNKKESASWVYEGMQCLAPDDDLCLVSLSDGGRDEAVIREFQVSTKQFVVGGFEVPAAKTRVSWIDKDTLFIGTNMGPDSLTSSGYPRQIRIWKRGTPLAESKLIFTGNVSDVSVDGFKNHRQDSGLMYLSQGLNFFEDKLFLFDGTHATPLPFPTTADFQGDFNGQLMAMLRQDWKAKTKTYPAGTVISIPVNQVGKADAESHIEVIFTPNKQQAFQGFAKTKDYLLLSALNNVRGEILKVTRTGGKWISHPVKMPNDGTLTIIDSSDYSDDVFVTYQTYNVPTSLYYGHGDLTKPLKKIKSLPAKFDASDIVTEQHQAKSHDGTMVPYFIVHKKGMTLNGSNPTLLYAYGGFEISETPLYSGVTGKIWLEKGGVYVVANIRGGGEFGPRWHEAALKENRQRAYDDFASVARDLVSRKITSARRLGIQGGSNGGLLMGVALTQHPELYNGVVCESALLDMIRYTQMPPGASWIGEYGDPADPAVAAYISKFSPYQNIQSGEAYPEAFFHISTADDRVQPGHTRKMVARLEEKGHPVLFFENTEGGHGGAADPEQTVHKIALEYTYLYRKLMD
jgi:prolyl oligopeptidase